MATNTTNYGWTKPDYEDDADIAVLNETFDAIDEQVKTNENNILSKIGASDYATQNTGGTVRVWTTTDGTDTILHISNEAPTP